jgi:hypothetical protein
MVLEEKLFKEIVDALTDRRWTMGHHKSIVLR